MMPTAEGMSHTIPNHVLRVGQTIRLDEAQEAVNQSPRLSKPGGNQANSDLDVSLDNLNQLILELDPTFEPLQINKSPSCISPPTDSDDDVSHCVLVPRGCSSGSASPTVPSVSPSIPIPAQSGLSCRTNGMSVLSGSPACSLPPLPCGSVLRHNPSPRQDNGFPPGSRLSTSNRNSATSLLSTSTCSDTSYILGSSLSLASEDADSPESILNSTSASFSDVSSMRLFESSQCPEKPPLTRQGHLQDLGGKGAQSSPASLSSSFTDIPVLLVNGAPQPHLLPVHSPAPQTEKPPSPHSFQARFSGSQPCMKFVMDTSKFWFRPHISRAEAEDLIKDKDPGTFVIRDSTSYRGSFGLAMKVDHQLHFTASAYPGDSSSESLRHFLIESSTKGVRIKGSAHEPYFGSLSALVYQHTISACALPCRLLLHAQVEEKNDKSSSSSSSSSSDANTACNFIYLNAVHTETLTGPHAVQKAVSSTLEKTPRSFTPTVVNVKASRKGVTLTDINRKLFFRRHYPAHLLSYAGDDPDRRLWNNKSTFAARMFGFVAKGVEAGSENVVHVFAEYDALQSCDQVVEMIQAVTKT